MLPTVALGIAAFFRIWLCDSGVLAVLRTLRTRCSGVGFAVGLEGVWHIRRLVPVRSLLSSSVSSPGEGAARCSTLRMIFSPFLLR